MKMYKLRITVIDSEHDGYCSDPGTTTKFTDRIYIAI